MKKATFTFDKCIDCPFYKELWGMAYCPKLEDKRERNFSLYDAKKGVHKDCPLEDEE